MRFAALSLLVLSSPMLGNAAAGPARPNIVFVISDDHRWDCIGAAGNPHVRTPHLDKLATEGRHFIQATMNIPQCSPARAQLLTGLPPHQNGWYSNYIMRKSVLDPDGFKDMPTVPGLLHKGGYRTALVGKWHLAPEPWNCGFSDVRTWTPRGSGPYKDMPMCYGNSRDTSPTLGFTQDIFGDDAAKFIREASSRPEPFFLWVALTAPHTPLRPNPPHIEEMYEGKTEDKFAPPDFTKGTFEEQFTSFTEWGKPTGPTSGTTAENWKPRRVTWDDYYAAITSADEQVGKITSSLEESGLTTNTIVVFIGDNGMMRHSRGWSGKVLPYEESVRVPLVISAPQLAKAKGQTKAQASSLDLSPSFLKWAGVEVPADWAGRDLTPALLSDDVAGLEHSISEYPDNVSRKFGPLAYRSIRTENHKLIVWDDPSKGVEFFDLKQDPRELTNRIADAAYQPEIQRLQKLLKDWQAKTKDTGAPTDAVEKRGGDND